MNSVPTDSIYFYIDDLIQSNQTYHTQRYLRWDELVTGTNIFYCIGYCSQFFLQSILSLKISSTSDCFSFSFWGSFSAGETISYSFLRKIRSSKPLLNFFLSQPSYEFVSDQIWFGFWCDIILCVIDDTQYYHMLKRMHICYGLFKVHSVHRGKYVKGY